jgi:hypothetical protein
LLPRPTKNETVLALGAVSAVVLEVIRAGREMLTMLTLLTLIAFTICPKSGHHRVNDIGLSNPRAAKPNRSGAGLA